MNQSFFEILLSIAASMFFGILSNWVYESLREKGILPNKPTFKKIAIIVLVGLAFIIFTNLKVDYLNIISDYLNKSFMLPTWVIVSILVLAGFIGFLLGQLRASKLINSLIKKQKRFETLEKRYEQSETSLQDISKEHIINPK